MNKPNEKQNALCKFCDHELSSMGDCYVCNNCKTMAYPDEAHNFISTASIQATMDSIQSHLTAELSFLHCIEQNHCNGKELCTQEKKIRDFCLDFQDCRGWIQTFLDSNMSIYDTPFRKQLYQLLDLSLRFNAVFGRDCIALAYDRK